MLEPNEKLAIYMEGAVHSDTGKMGSGILRYSRNPIVCVIDQTCAGSTVKQEMRIDRDCPIVGTIDEAVKLGAEALVLGIAPPGGLIPPAWLPDLDRAWAAGLSLINGLHDLLGSRYPSPIRSRQKVWDIRIEPEGLVPGTGAASKLTNKRLLLIGTDMAVGKMTAGLQILDTARSRGISAEFVATGQIGITITGAGVPLDAVRVDYASGSIEREVMKVKDADLVIIEGQGSLIHPGSTANLPLIRGSCPTHMVVVARAGQTHLLRVPWVKIPPLKNIIDLYETLASACATFETPKTVGVALNTFHLSAEEAEAECRRLEDEVGLPVVDTVRNGADRLVDALNAD